MKGKIFNAQEVQAIIAGNKRMFREVVKNANYDSPVHSYKDWENNGLYYPIGTLVDENSTQTETQYSFDGIKCPYQIGQEIFCKESFREGAFCKHHFKADDKERKWGIGSVTKNFLPAQHMKQEHSRLTLQIKKIRVERLADISKEDIIKEGFKPDERGYLPDRMGRIHMNPWIAFEIFWNATHKKPEEKFEASPFVWCVTFEVVKLDEKD